SKYETLMTRLLEAGVNHVNGVEFDVAEPRKYRDETRLKAIRAAREKAEAMAAELGQKIGKPWEITDESSANYGALPNLSYGVVANASFSHNAQGAADESTIAPGQVEISATVRVSFVLE